MVVMVIMTPSMINMMITLPFLYHTYLEVQTIMSSSQLILFLIVAGDVGMGREKRRPLKSSEVQTLSEAAILVKRTIPASALDCLDQQ